MLTLAASVSNLELHGTQTSDDRVLVVDDGTTVIRSSQKSKVAS